MPKSERIKSGDTVYYKDMKLTLDCLVFAILDIPF